jgi:hypothetical protein
VEVAAAVTKAKLILPLGRSVVLPPEVTSTLLGRAAVSMVEVPQPSAPMAKVAAIRSGMVAARGATRLVYLRRDMARVALAAAVSPLPAEREALADKES